VHQRLEAVHQAADGRFGDAVAAGSGAGCCRPYHSTTKNTTTRFQTSMLISDRIMARSSSSRAGRVAHQGVGQQEHLKHCIADHRPPSGANAP